MFELPVGIPRRVSLFAIAAIFVFAGVGHFTDTDFFVSIVPPYLPWHLELVYVSGVFEILGGVGVLPIATRRAAGLGLVALLIAVFPANIHMALHPEQFEEMSRTALYIRLPIQFVVMAWVWWATRADERTS
jgi:uncharacterized membrane protein